MTSNIVVWSFLLLAPGPGRKRECGWCLVRNAFPWSELQDAAEIPPDPGSQEVKNESAS